MYEEAEEEADTMLAEDADEVERKGVLLFDDKEKKKKKSSDRYVAYVIYITMLSGYHWTIERRYSDFLTLYEHLCKEDKDVR